MTTQCLYSIIRYTPYADLEEFANIGVVICAPKENYFDFQLTKRNDARIKNFFHDDNIFPAARDAIDRELQAAKVHAKQIAGAQDSAQFFRYFTARRESIFHFSATRVVLAQDPKVELARIYNHYVNHAEYTKERREEVLAREIKRSLERVDGLKNVFKPESVDGVYAKFTMPLVAKTEDHIQRAIKPLAFTQHEPGKMMEHCDTWVMRINRAAEENLLEPENVLFTIESPDRPTDGQKKALDIIRKTIDKHKIEHWMVSDEEQTIRFAKMVIPPTDYGSLIN